MARFTVIGAGGFIGAHVVSYLERRGHETWAPGRDERAIYERDLGYVVYCAGIIRDRWQRLFETTEAHVGLLAQILARSSFTRLTYLSSVLVYDGITGLADETAELRFDPQRLDHFYTTSKAAGEALVYHTGRPATVVRLANVYDDRLAREDFLCRTVSRALATTTLEVDSNPEDGRDYIHVGDVCPALERITLGGREVVYNLATGVNLANRELADLCEQFLGCRVAFHSREEIQRPPVISVDRLAREYGIRAQPAGRRLPEILQRSRDDRLREKRD